jgi:hypothetical protein
MATDSDPVGHCVRCGRRLSKRQAVVDWALVISKAVWEVLQFFWS